MRASIIACAVLCTACHTDVQNLGFTAVGAPRWAIQLGSIDNDWGGAVAIDSIGDVVAIGEFGGSYNSQNLQPTTGFITKRVASDGSERWTVKLVNSADPTLSYIGMNSVAIDPSDDSIVVTGTFNGTVDFGGQTLSSGTMFLAKYSTSGQLQWVRGLGENDGMYGASMAIDSTGNIAMAGAFGGTLELGSAEYTVPPNDQGGFVMEFDPSGNQLWGTAFPGTDMGGPVPQLLALDANDDVIVAGGMGMPASVGGATLTPTTAYDSFLARFRKDGLYLASQLVTPGPNVESGVSSLTVDVDNHAVLQLSELGEPVGSGWGHETLHAFDDSGHAVWSTTLADNGDGAPQLRTLVTMPNGYIMSSAWDDGPYDADNPSAVTGEMEQVALDAGGHTSTAEFGRRMLGGAQSTRTNGAAASANGTLAYVGTFSGEIELANGPLMNPGQGDTDAFIVLLDSAP
ncbi:MAG TPA: hypothetical protein VGL61_05390 [Kofleriaceae bacterium]|jgi:hypothetical protein